MAPEQQTTFRIDSVVVGILVCIQIFKRFSFYHAWSDGKTVSQPFFDRSEEKMLKKTRLSW